MRRSSSGETDAAEFFGYRAASVSASMGLPAHQLEDDRLRFGKSKILAGDRILYDEVDFSLLLLARMFKVRPKPYQAGGRLIHLSAQTTKPCGWDEESQTVSNF